jgi:F-type H+-transporting ATPase subunit delta
LAQNGDLNKYQEIEKEFHILEGKAKGVQQAEVTVAREMEMNSKIINDLNKIVNVGNGLDRSLQVQTTVDESIIGGVVVRVEDTLIDASVKTQLTNLNNSLKTF